MIKTKLIDSASGKQLEVQQGLYGCPTLITESARTLDAHWKSGINDASETTIIVEAKTDESILVTDIIITSSKKVANSTVTVQFYDGTNTENLMVIEGVTSPVEFSHGFIGGLRGWKNADLQVVTDQAAMYVITTVVYVHIPTADTLGYAAWDALR